MNSMKTNYPQVVQQILDMYDTLRPKTVEFPVLFLNYWEVKMGELEELDPEFDESLLIQQLLMKPQFTKVLFPQFYN